MQISPFYEDSISPTFLEFQEKSIRVLQVPNDRRSFIPSSSSFIFIHRHFHPQQQQWQQQFILHASKNEGLESGFEVDRLGKAVHGFPSGRYFKKVDQCLLALFFPRCGRSLKQKYTTLFFLSRCPVSPSYPWDPGDTLSLRSPT